MTMRGNGVSMANLAAFLTPGTDRMVQDRTGLSGLFDWQLTFSRPGDPRAGSTVPSDTPPAPPLVVALQEQLGLKLESARVPVEFLVIDSAALPEPG